MLTTHLQAGAAGQRVTQYVVGGVDVLPHHRLNELLTTFVTPMPTLQRAAFKPTAAVASSQLLPLAARVRPISTFGGTGEGAVFSRCWSWFSSAEWESTSRHFWSMTVKDGVARWCAVYSPTSWKWRPGQRASTGMWTRRVVFGWRGDNVVIQSVKGPFTYYVSTFWGLWTPLVVL